MMSIEVRNSRIGRPGLSRSRSVNAQQVSWIISKTAMQTRNASVLAMVNECVVTGQVVQQVAFKLGTS